MRKFINYLILLFFIGFLYSCTINVSNKDNNGNNGNGDSSQITMDNPSPSDSATGVLLTPYLGWDVQSSNTNNLRYDIYLDTSNQLNIPLAQVYTQNYYIYTPLDSNKTYYWKIRAIYDNGDAYSNIWRFTTIGGLPTNGLVAYYPFNGNVNDASGNGHHGQNYGANLIMDRFNNSNKAYSFNGINSYIMVPHSSSLQPTNGLTLSAWVKFNSLNNTCSILGKGSDASIGWYSLRYESAGRTLDFQINFSDYIGGPRKTVSINTTLQINVWYNVIGTFNGNSMKIYLNGQFSNLLPISSTLGSNSEALQIGSSVEGYFLNGALDDIRIYNRALNDAEVLQLYHEGGWQKK
jgi:hypothetical protein